MTTFVAVFLSCWVMGFALGWKMKMIRMAMYAA